MKKIVIIGIIALFFYECLHPIELSLELYKNEY